MIKNKDLLGNKARSGDILIDVTGLHSFDENDNLTYKLNIWEKPIENDGSGYEYGIDGNKYRVWWRRVQESIILDKNLLPEGFEYSFKHGMNDINTLLENGAAKELIENSDWKDNEVKKEEVEYYNFIQNLKIETLEDLKKNIEQLRKCSYVPYEIVSNVLNIAGVEKETVKNGEIGIARMCDMFKYQSVIYNINLLDKN